MERKRWLLGPKREAFRTLTLWPLPKHVRHKEEIGARTPFESYIPWRETTITP